MGGSSHLRIVPDERPREEIAGLIEVARAPITVRTYHLLLVEDNLQVGTLYEHALSRLRSASDGVDVSLEYVRDGAEALGRLGRNPRVELVVTDLYMPVMDGFMLLERMRGDPALVMTPVLAISAGSPEARERAVELGADVCLEKPVKIADLVGTARALLRLA